MMGDSGILPSWQFLRCSFSMKTTGLLVFFFSFCCLPGAFAQVTLNQNPTRAIGQDSVIVRNVNPNLVEGREFDVPEGLALDLSTNPPALYVSDYGNNRVLGFKNAVSFANGQPADLVLGQPDLFTTLPPAAATTLATGLLSPSGIAVDAEGNVYVMDSGDNRILRFPKPFAKTGSQVPDLVIGQASFTTNGANQGGISASTLALSSAAGPLLAYMTFDTAGNLWVSDAGNNRVLRFNASVLGTPPTLGPAADIVLGHADFVSSAYTPPAFSNPLTSLSSFTTPSGIAFDTAGRLFVAESIATRPGRILMWTPPFSTGQPASRVLAVDTANPPPSAPNALQLGPGPGALFPIGSAIGAVDTFYSRILIFPPVEQWIPNSTFQAAVEVAGQSYFTSGSSNLGNPTAGPIGLSFPSDALFFGSTLYVADSFNNRVILLPQNGTAFGPATKVLGQDLLTLNAPNLVEGREFDFGNGSVGFDSGLAVDLHSSPPHLYVADPYNNRILGFNNLITVQSGQKADIVIGQPDFQQVLTNYPTNNPNQPNASGLFAPTGLAVDSSGNLYVADRGNGRVLRFPQPFANYTPGTMEQADLVLGQASFTTPRITDATDRTMAEAYGLAFTLAGGLAVSDPALNRVLYFAGPLANLTSGMPASMVFGQPDFNSIAPGSGPGQMNNPRHIATDTDDRLYVADPGNARVDIYNHAPTALLGQPAAQFLTAGLHTPEGLYVSAATGEIWVADPGANGALRFPQFNQLAPQNSASNGFVVDNVGPMAVSEDAWGNLLLADSGHRVLLYYAGLGPINAANFLNPGIMAPGMIAAMFTEGNHNQFGGQPSHATDLPLPTQLNGVEVLFNNAPVPLFYADPNQINFQVPIEAPQTGTADLRVVEIATGRVMGDTTVAMAAAVPGLFTQAGSGIGAAAALNQDGTVNNQFNPAVQGSVITLFGTGQGFIPGAPPDGNISNAPLKTPQTPEVIVGTGFVPTANVQYSGLSPALVGVWQLNILIPDSVITTPTNPTQVIAIQNNVPSGGGGLGRPVIIYVKQKP
jgi:uncharacterized protein (TIGR03437 family)